MTTELRTQRYFYAVHSYMGLSFTLDSACYRAHAFPSRRERDAWVARYEYLDGQYVARAATRAEAYKVAGLGSMYKCPVILEENNQLVAG